MVLLDDFGDIVKVKVLEVDLQRKRIALTTVSYTHLDVYKRQGLNSENFVAFNLTERMQLIGGTWYGGEMKKGMFSMMNYAYIQLYLYAQL